MQHRAGQGVAEGAGDRVAEARGRGGDPQVAVGGHREATADADTVDRGDGDLRERPEPLEHLPDPVLVVDRVGLDEVGDLVARGERLAAGPAQDHHAHGAVLGRLLPELAHLGVHRLGEGIAALGAVEGHLEHAGCESVAVDQQIIGSHLPKGSGPQAT